MKSRRTKNCAIFGPPCISQKYSNKWTKIGVDIEICLGNNQANFQLHRFTRRDNTAKSFLTHTVQQLSLLRCYDTFSTKMTTTMMIMMMMMMMMTWWQRCYLKSAVVWGSSHSERSAQECRPSPT